MFDLDKMSFEELQQIHDAINMEMKERKEHRYQELVQNVCDAMNALASEFPSAELRVDFRCSECGIDDGLDVMDYFCNRGCRRMTPDCFTRY